MAPRLVIGYQAISGIHDTNRKESRALDHWRKIVSEFPTGDRAARDAATARQQVLTKPLGSLGRLEELAIWAATWQGRAVPRETPIQVLVFAGNHGVAARGVSAYPTEVTAQMVANFSAGGAAINQLCGIAGARLDVHAIELDRPTEDFTKVPAMSAAECARHMQFGLESVDSDAALLCVGEMGIANTTAAAALANALFGGTPNDWVGRGTGVDDDGLDRKRATVAAALHKHQTQTHDPLEALRRVGGRELAAMAGAVAGARQRRIPVLLDGYVATAAAAVLARLTTGGLDHCRAAHCSAEAGHRHLLEALGLSPILDLGMRLGEASGAALAANIVRAAISAHNGMATFGEAGVSESSKKQI